MSLERVPPRAKAPCRRKIHIEGRAYACVKKDGHTSAHRIEGPINFQSASSGLTVVIDRSIEWTETLL